MLRISDVSYRYKTRKIPTLKHLSLHVTEGEMLLLAGCSGCGKSTLIKAVSGLLNTAGAGELDGKIYLNNKDTAEMTPEDIGILVGTVYQSPDDQLFAMTVSDEVGFALENQGLDENIISVEVQKVLERVGLAGFEQNSIHTLSGGQRQRLALASVLITKPKLLVLDEPVSQMNPQGVEDFLQLLVSLNRIDGITIIVVEHRVNELAKYFPRLAVMFEGEVIYDGPIELAWQKIGSAEKYGLREPQKVKLCRFLHLSKLIDETSKVVDLIKSECKIEKTEIVIKLGDKEEFTLKGNVIIEKGWTKYDDYNKNDKVLPSLNIGDEVNINFKPKEKKKSAPKHYTIETLNNYLKNPFKEDKNKADEEMDENKDDTEDYKAIFEGLELGTEATRTGIINNAINSKYIALKKDVYTILPDGKYLIEELKKMNISMDKYKTSELGKGLKQVYKGNISINDVVLLTEKEISEVFDSKNTENDTGFYREVIGKCPLCGKDVIKGKYNYGCIGYKDGCNFKISTMICKKIINKNVASEILKNKISPVIEGFISKNNKEFKARLKLEDDGRLSFVFD